MDFYFSGQGKLLIASRDVSGNPGVFRNVGNVPELRVTLTLDELEHKESTSGQRLTDHIMTRGKSAGITFGLEQFSIGNLELALYGANSVQNAAAVTDEEFPNPVVAGNLVRLEFPKVSGVVIDDSTTPTPITLVLGTNYRIYSADHGTIEILDPAALVQPFKADYSYAQHTRIGMFTQPAPERYFRFEGLNTEDSNEPVLIELYRVRLNPLAELPIINEDVARFAMTGGVLFDETRALDTVLGQFGRFVSMV